MENDSSLSNIATVSISALDTKRFGKGRSNHEITGLGDRKQEMREQCLDDSKLF